jgi:integral membrane sensor domain MASE1
MSGSSTIGLFALMAMVVLYAIESSVPVARLGFAAACLLAALSDFALGRWPFGAIALGFGLVAVRRWNSLRRQRGPAGRLF